MYFNVFSIKVEPRLLTLEQKEFQSRITELNVKHSTSEAALKIAFEAVMMLCEGNSTSSADITRFLQISLARLISVDRVQILRYESDTNQFVGIQSGTRFTLPTGDGLTSSCSKAAAMILCNDLSNHDKYVDEIDGSHRFNKAIYYPLEASGHSSIGS